MVYHCFCGCTSHLNSKQTHISIMRRNNNNNYHLSKIHHCYFDSKRHTVIWIGLWAYAHICMCKHTQIIRWGTFWCVSSWEFISINQLMETITSGWACREVLWVNNDCPLTILFYLGWCVTAITTYFDCDVIDCSHNNWNNAKMLV